MVEGLLDKFEVTINLRYKDLEDYTSRDALQPGGPLLQVHGMTPPAPGGWQGPGSRYGVGQENQVTMMQMFAMLRQENHALRAEQVELMEEMKNQQASFEARVHNLQQTFRTPESSTTFWQWQGWHCVCQPGRLLLPRLPADGSDGQTGHPPRGEGRKKGQSP